MDFFLSHFKSSIRAFRGSLSYQPPDDREEVACATLHTYLGCLASSTSVSSFALSSNRNKTFRHAIRKSNTSSILKTTSNIPKQEHRKKQQRLASITSVSSFPESGTSI